MPDEDRIEKLLSRADRCINEIKILTDSLNAIAREIELHGDQRDKDTDAHQR
jgi:hypothetical protein